MDTLIENLITEARSYLGVKWRHQGRSRSGVDCVGFILLALKHINIPMLEIKGYSRNPDGIKLKEIMDKQPNMRTLLYNEKIKVGDILLLRIRKDPQHVALITNSTTSKLGMIHSYNGGEKKVIEHDFVDYWKNKIVAVYRINIK